MMINLEKITHAFNHGFNRILAEKETLNQINLFPVADKDTGSNLSVSLSNAYDASQNVSNITEYLAKLSECVFYQARGNSGVMFSIWFEGIASDSTVQEAMSYATWFRMLDAGENALSRHIPHAVEGSLVSFVRDCSKLWQNFVNLDKAELIAFEEIDRGLLECLQATKSANPILRDQDVVDAGALAMYYFLSSVFEVILDVTAIKSKAGRSLRPSQNMHHKLPTKPSERYCTEAMLTIKDDQFERAKQLIGQYGSCDLFLRKGDLIRFHVHCNNPAALFAALSDFCLIRSPKIDDMLRQYQAVHSQHQIALVSDSSLDLPESMLDHYQVHRIPLNIMQNDQEWLDGIGILPEHVYNQISSDKDYPTTSTPSLGRIKDVLEHCAKHYQYTLVITVASKLSGTFSAINSIAKAFPRTHVFDSCKNSGAHGLLVKLAGELIEKRTPMDEVMAALERARDQTQIFVAIDNFHAMARSGRITNLQAFIADSIHVKPLATLNALGEGLILKKAFGRKRSLRKLESLIVESHLTNPIKTYCMMHCQADLDISSFAERLEHALGFKPLFIKPVSPAIGLHAGEGAIAVAFMQE